VTSETAFFNFNKHTPTVGSIHKNHQVALFEQSMTTTGDLNMSTSSLALELA